MKRAVVALTLFAVLALPTMAAAASANMLTAHPGQTHDAGELARDLLFLQLDTPPVGQAQTWTVEYRVDGALVFSESLEAALLEAPAENRPAVLELLAWHPQVREHLLRASRNGAEVTIDVTHDGATRRMTLDAVVTRTHELQELGPMPAKHRSEALFQKSARRPADSNSLTSKAKDPGCINQCWAEYDQCEDYCSQYGGGAEDCYERCDADFQSCTDACPDVCTGPTVREYSDTVPAGFNYIGPSRCLTWGFFNYIYDYGTFVLKTTDYRETTYCDGSKTTEVLGVTYTYINCWLRSYQDCYYPVGDAFYYYTCPY